MTDLSPNDPRAVVEDPAVVREEEILRRAGRRFLLGFRVAAAAFLVALVLTPGTIWRAAAVIAGFLFLTFGLVLSAPAFLEYHRARRRE